LAALLRSLAAISSAVFIGVLIGAVAFALAACAAYAAWGVSIRRIAWLIDRRAVLKDRLTNALEFAARPQRSPLMELAIADAEAAAIEAAHRARPVLWTRGHTKRAATLALILPLLYAAAVINLADYFRQKNDFLGAIKPPMPSELASGGFEDMPATSVLLPAMTGLHGLLGDWRAKLVEMRERAQQLAMTAPLKEPELPETIYRETPKREAHPGPQILGVDGLPAVRLTDRLHASDARALGDVDPNVDASMREAFAQLDQTLLDADPQLAAVEAYVNQLRDGAAKGKDAGVYNSLQSIFGDANAKRDKDQQGAFRNKTQGAQQQEFNEFLSQYAAHLGRMVDAKREINDKRQQAALQDGAQPQQKVLTADQGQQLPENAQLRMVHVTEDMLRGVKLNNDVGQQLPPGAGRGAGPGGGTFRGAYKVKHEQTVGQGREERLRGLTGEGKSSVQIFEDADADPGAFSKLLQSFQADAQERLQDQTIPASVRAYVQRYLSSISPEPPAPGSK
jgi:hypothetical protein